MASVRVLNGSGVNPQTLDASSPPRLGQALSLELDCSAHASGTAFLSGRGAPGQVLLPPYGEVLTDLSRPGLFRVAQPHLGGRADFGFTVPDDTALCGFELYVQGLCFGAPGAQLSNALELTIGE